jgi:hypothetical protein
MKMNVHIVLIGLIAHCTLAQSPITVTIDTTAHGGVTTSADFAGLSFESSNLLPGPNGEHLLAASNKPLIELFRTLGIRSLRVGGGTADMAKYAMPGEKDVDHLFAFAAAADVKIIYTLRLPHADVAADAAIARYIQQHYAPQLTCFEIGNEPDFYRRVYREIPDYAAYRPLWKEIAAAVAKATPSAKFCGPAAGGTTSWARNFAADFAATGSIAAVVQHEYPGGDGNLMSDAPARDAMLSRAWLELYDRLYQSSAVAAAAKGLPFRLEETNNLTGGAKNATDTFTASLWALEYMHWWAAHGAAGINFHNRRWILNTTIYPEKDADDGLGSGYHLHPIAYGIKAFELSAHGTSIPVAIANPDAVNFTAYAVRGDAYLLVTLINKKDPGAKLADAKVTIVAPGSSGPSQVMFLSAPNAAAKDGITLGGASFNNAMWDGEWTSHSGTTIDVPGTSAAIVRLPLKRSE